ncbi:MAG: glycosyltransferase family 4 protein [Actinobacteria bacterium]|nr:glycosyltransferase family 4 protein [Actinomycetota bacterium]
MRIGINLIPLWPGKIGGMETYIRNLLDHIAALDRTNEYFLFTADWNDDTLDFANPNFKKVLVEKEIPQFAPREISRFERSIYKIRYVRYLYKTLRRVKTGKLTKIIRDLSIDVWFCPLMSLDPRYLRIPAAITIPDVQQEYYPQFFTDKELFNRATNWRQSCHEATKVLTISEFSKRSLCDKYHLSPDKVEVTLQAVGDEFLSTDGAGDNRIAEKYSLPKAYAFYPANTWAHKNHQLLIMGFALFKKRSNSNLKLVLSGVSDAREQLQALIDRYNLVDDVVFLGYIQRAEMPAVYRSASFMIFPSLFEGFGIPLLEAMASDCPIAASKMTSIPEVAGDAALYFDPRNPEAIAAVIEKMVDDAALRHNLAQAGRKQLKKFSWDKTAQRTLHVLEELYRESKSRG